MKILSLNNYHYLRGGSERYFLDQKALLETHGHEVVTFSTHDRRNEGLAPDSVLVPQLDLQRPDPAAIARFVFSRRNRAALERLLDGARFDVAHLHIYYGQLTAAVLAPLASQGIPIVQTLHEYRLFCPVSTLFRDGAVCEACRGGRFRHAVAGRCNRGSLARSGLSALETWVSHRLGATRAIDRFVTVSEFQRRKMIELGLPAEKIRTIHNFKDAAGLQPASTPGRHFLYFGRLERIKGLFTLLEAAAALPQVPLIVAGEGEARAELERQARERGLDHVSFVGFKRGAELEALIRDSICTLLPSQWWETFGLTTLESFALGRPVVGARIGGIPEVITDGTDGLLVEPGDAAALRDALAWMADHRYAAVEMGREGRRTLESRFDPATHYRKLAELYRELANGGP